VPKTEKRFLQEVWTLCEAILSRPEGIPDDIIRAARDVQKETDDRFAELVENEGEETSE